MKKKFPHQFRILVYLFFVFAITSLTSSCATLLKFENSTITIIPENSRDRINIQVTHPERPFQVTIPNTVNIQRLHPSSRIRVIDPCYQEGEISIQTKFSLVTLLNVYNGGYGLLVDYLTGEMWQYRRITRVPVIKKQDCEQPLDNKVRTSIFAEIISTNQTNTANTTSTAPSLSPSSQFKSGHIPQQESIVDTILHRMKAVQFKYLSGSATVRSFVENDQEKYEVANGNAAYSGYEISLQSPNLLSGWSYSLTPRYINQSISIADFREKIPQSSIPDTETIPMDVTDYESGNSVDPNDPNVYDIDLSSWGIVGEVQYHWSRFCRHTDCQLFGEIATGIGIIEQVNMNVHLGSRSIAHTQWKMVPSYYLVFSVGFLKPSINSALQLQYNYLQYPRLVLPQRVEFRDKVKYNQQKQVFERERVFLDEVRLEISAFQLSYTFFFK